MTDKNLIASVEQIESRIFLILGRKEMPDEDRAALHGVETKVLNRALKRDIERFSDDPMSQRPVDEFANLWFLSGTPNSGSQIATLKSGRE